MIGSIAASTDGLDAYFSTQSAANVGPASGQEGDLQMTPQEAGVGDLTAADWKLVSAAVGKDVGPNANGQVSGVQSLFAVSIEQERELGNLAPGQELTIGDLKSWASDANQAQGLTEQIQNAISYLEQNSTGSAGHAVNIAA